MNNEYTSHDCNCSSSRCFPPFPLLHLPLYSRMQHAAGSSDSPAGQGTGFDIIVVRRPFVQGAIVGHIVVGGTLVRTEVLLLRTRLHVADAIASALAATIAGSAATAHLLHDAAVAGARTCWPLRPGGPLTAAAGWSCCAAATILGSFLLLQLKCTNCWHQWVNWKTNTHTHTYYVALLTSSSFSRSDAVFHVSSNAWLAFSFFPQAVCESNRQKLVWKIKKGDIYKWKTK